MLRIANPIVRRTALAGLLATSTLMTLAATGVLAQQVTGVPVSPSVTPPPNRGVLSEQEIKAKSA